MPAEPDAPNAGPSPPNEDIVLVNGPWDGYDFEFATPELQELWFLDRNLVVNQLANDAAAKAYDPVEGALDPDVLFGHIRRTARKMADLTTASVYRRRPGTNRFEFVRTEPEDEYERRAREGHFDGPVCQRG